MRTSILSALALAATLALSASAVADPWKDESGHGHRGGPPPWAPAHGQRRKQEARHEHRDEHRERETEIRVSRESVVIRNGRCDREAAGAVIGGILGGVIGTEVGRENGNTEFGMVAGAIIGVVLGSNIGRGMDDRDASCIAHALDKAPDGKVITWRNPEAGLDFRLTPVNTFKRDGRLCRRYRTETATISDVARGESEACQTADGKWQLGI